MTDSRAKALPSNAVFFLASAPADPCGRATPLPNICSYGLVMDVQRPASPEWGAGDRHVASNGGYVMLNYDFSPFYRSTIGFDRLLSLLDKHSGPDSNGQSYPPYNIERTGENAYRITLAVAGFSNAELAVETRENTLTVRGSKEAVEKGESDKREVL